MNLPTVLVHGKSYYWDARLSQLRSAVAYPEPIDFVDWPRRKFEYELAIEMALNQNDPYDLGEVIDELKELQS